MNGSTGHGFVTALLESAKPYRRKFAVGLVATSLASLADASSPMLLKWGIDALQAGKPEAWLYGFCSLIVLVAAVGGIFRFQMRDIVVGTSRWVESDLRESFFAHLLRLPPAFFDRHHTGDLMARATDDIERVRMVLGPALLYAVNTGLTLFFASIMMFYLDYRLALLLLILAPIVSATMLWIARELHKANMRQQEVYGALTTVVQENVSGIRVIKSYARENYEVNRFAEVLGHYFGRSLKVAQLQALMFPLITFLIGIGIAGILWIGGGQANRGEITLGDFIAFMGYLSLMAWPMIALGWVVHLYQRGSASHKRLTYVLDTPLQFPDATSAGQTTESTIGTHPDVIFKDISFRYREEGPDVLSGISFTLPAGRAVAIVGQTGSGKSSIARILTRLYQPQTGAVYLGDRLWDSIPITELRNLVSYVDQTPFLFSTSIKENIKFGNPEASDVKMEAAAYTACFDNDVIEFPHSYDTIIGERGVTLSGGQQQRLTLARALVTDAPILVLDDALSAVDADTEAEIIQRLKERANGRTLLLITHRLAAAEMADAVAVLEAGRLIEFGPPDELIANGGTYSIMYRRQRLAQEIEEL